jgi:hypothetical protein
MSVEPLEKAGRSRSYLSNCRQPSFEQGQHEKYQIVETRPTGTTIVVVGNKVYKTRAEADKELAVVCK